MKIKRNRCAITPALIATYLIGTSSAGLAQDATKLEDSVVFAMPGGPVQDVLQKCTFDDFTKKFNVRVDVLSIQPQPTLARVLSQRNNETIDVTWSLAATDYQGYKAGVFMPVTAEQVPNLANIDPKFLPEPHSGALLTTAIQGIEYNTKIFADKGWAPPKSWRDLWDPKYLGHIGINDLSVTSGQGLLAATAFINGGDPKNFDAGFEALTKLKPNLYTIFSQVPQFDAAMLDERAWLGVTSNGRALGVVQQGAPIAFVQPSEGVVVGNVFLPIVNGAPHPNAALVFVNWMLSKEAQSCWPRAGYAPIVKGVGVPADMAPYVTIKQNIIPVDWVLMQDKLPELLKRWNRDING